MLRVIKSAHFANGRKPAFTLVDLQADRVRERLAQRHPALESLCEIGWIDGEMSAADTQCRIAHRTSPHLVPWEELDESIRQIDRDAVQAIAPVMVDLTGSSPAPTHETS